ncbi:hypothetical protein IWX65_002711 [Arthrobacter sp. CAN_A214]|uniref:hypothetical protein n=1 Tax=Arthrobacter sp. CAN_A214 TaxID=2787720 RepID=UPI0018C904CD
MSITTVSATPAQDALLRAWIWLSFHKKTRILLAVVFTCFLCQMVNATMAQAADEDQGIDPNTYWLPLAGVTDTHGVPVGKYTELPLDYGNMTHPQRTVRGMLMRLAWMGYTVGVYGTLALCNFVLSLEWIDWILSPFILLANSIQGLLDSTGIVGLGIFIAAIVIAWGMIRGRIGAAILEASIVALFVGLVSMPIANPSDHIKNWIGTSASVGTEVGTRTVSDSDAEADTSANPVSGQIVDIAVRTPALMLAFGSNLDGDSCAQTWDDQAKSGADAEELRKAVLSCNGDLEEANETDNFNVFAFMAMFLVSTTGLTALIAVFLIFLVKDVLLAGLGLINTVFRVHLAVFPGGGRQAFLNAFFQLLVNVFMIGAYIFLLNLYLWLVGQLYDAVGATVMMIGNLIFGLVLIALAFTFWHLKKQGKSLAEKLAHTFGGSPMNRAPELKPSAFSQSASQLAGKGQKIASQHIKRRMMSKGVQAGVATATGGTSLAAQRMAAAGWFLAGHLAQNRPGAGGTGSAPRTQTHRPSASQALPATFSHTKDNVRDANGSIPMDTQAAPAPAAERNPAQARTLRTPEQLSAPTGDRVPSTTPEAAPAESQHEVNTAQPMGSHSTELVTTAQPSAQTSTGSDVVAARGSRAVSSTGTQVSNTERTQPLQPAPTTQPRSTLPAGDYGSVRIHRGGATNVMVGQIVDDVPAGAKPMRVWDAPDTDPIQARGRRNASTETGIYQMQRRSQNRAAERGEVR